MRECGTCHACCITAPVQSLGKPAMTPCKHLCHGSAGCCGIYDSRPNDCAVFKCAWLESEDQPGEARPDKTGVVFERSSINPTGNREITLYVAVETEPGKLDALEGDWLNSMTTNGSVVVTLDGGICGEPEDIEHYALFVRGVLSHGGVTISGPSGVEKFYTPDEMKKFENGQSTL